MTTRKERLRKLVTVQEKLKALHETRHAGHIAAAAAARNDAEELAARFDADTSMAVLFPEVYNKRISAALSREDKSLAHAKVEALAVATAKARTNMVDRAYRIESRKDERDSAERERLERAARRGPAEDK